MTSTFHGAAQGLQRLGRALMLPIAVLPVAALLLRMGQPDLLNLPFVSAAGDAMFANLGLLFAIGVATGFARDGNGAAPLAGVVCFLVATEGAKALLKVPADVVAGVAEAARGAVQGAWRQGQIGRVAVPLGIVSGMIGGLGYNRFSGFRPPDFLAFFGGKRFVPIIAGACGVLLAALVGFSHDAINAGVDGASRAALNSGAFGLFAYGLLNRLLLVTGLHHILNNIAWFVLGDYHGVTGDLRRFFAGDASAGAFMSGFFPVMMFGLPAACLAMYRSARPEKRRETGGMLASLAATSFLTGVTEPIEFSFMFLAPALFALHAVLTGAAMALMSLLNVHLGFGFSAGLFDYVLNFSKATRPLVLIPVGLAYFAIYYAVFRFAIVRLDLKTPGREEDSGDAAGVLTEQGRGAAFVAALGGADNLVEVGACTTRLRLVVARQEAVDEAALKALGARGLIRPSAQGLQVVLGPQADSVASEMQAAIAGGPVVRVAAPVAESLAALSPQSLPAPVRAALGTVTSLRAGHSRLVVEGPSAPDLEALSAHGLRGGVQLGGQWHLLFAPETISAWDR
ncbi:N-acetylglucosamine-specific PTS transporter subunit IIBC [Novosphingobium sediminicola]|uniref:PTS system N-acetylglucosamine-specific IIC component n=1 Tax=Novosphingobium sediminicola TaxID=563162 RepID=A0A7W6CCL9_9SPHN|nr:N-acetylglucosamine-specific PTS transporter subunit IIBC [Novosphingobium sediminicola]MBB3954104.1 PTS system N-acetylglucosamine-specific IIC component [Novosphingobium sediminicola]